MATSDYADYVLSVDDLEWTKHWLGQKRCDQIHVRIALSDDAAPAMRIRAVESKASGSTRELQVTEDEAPFDEAIEQIVQTLEALLAIADPESGGSVVEDLRFAGFVEHLAEVVLAEAYPVLPTDAGTRHALGVLSDLSTRTLRMSDIDVDGFAVCTQYRATVDRLEATVTRTIHGRDIQIKCIRVGADEVNQLLGPTSAPEPTPGGEVRRGVEEQFESVEDIETVRVPSEEQSTAAAETEPAVTEVLPGVGSEQAVSDRPHDEPALVGRHGSAASGNADAGLLDADLRLARDLYIACVHRGFKVEIADPPDVVVGPTVIGVGLVLETGASLRPIEAALEDLAREIGVSAENLMVRNHPDRRSHIQFLIPRADRDFPPLPDAAAPLVDAASSAYLGVHVGRDLSGSDVVSYVSRWPHLLVAGSTTSGKTTLLRAMLMQFDRAPVGLLKCVVVDGKQETDYFGVLTPERFVERYPDVLLGHEQVVDVFSWVVDEEIPRRRDIHRQLVVEQRERRSPRDIYVDAVTSGEDPPFAPLVVLVDEFAQLMLAGPATAREFERRVQQVAQVGRSMMVHLLLATQRPDANVISGAIKTNFPARVALSVPTHHDSMTMLGGAGAEKLMGRGDMIFRELERPDVRLQGYSTL